MMRKLVSGAGADVTVAAAGLGLYLGLLHLTSLAFGLRPAQPASVGAVVLLNVLVAARLLASPRLMPWRAVRVRSVAVSVFGGLALIAVLAVTFLHADFLIARARGEHYGLFDTPRLKALLILSQLMFLFLAALAESRVPRTLRSCCAIDRTDLTLFALVLVPLVNYFARNRDTFTPIAAAGYFLTFLGVALLAALFLVAYQRMLGARPLAVPLVIALAFLHYSLPMVSALLERPIELLFRMQVSLAVILPALMAAAYLANRRALRTFVLLFSISSAAASLIMTPPVAALDRRYAPQGAPEPGGGLSAALSAPITRRPGVYLLVYDGYAPRPMMARYGIDNTAADTFLARHDFTSYDEVYSLYHASYRSMSPPGAGIDGASAVTGFFKAHGYKTHLVLHSYLLNSSAPSAADYTFPPAHRRSALGTLYRGIAAGEFKSDVVFDDLPRDEWIGIKRQVLAGQLPRPKMVYAHSGMPGHGQNSGTCLADETARYEERLALANQEMEQDITTILASDPGAVIIVAGDHGPYLTGDCLYMERTAPQDLTAVELADRYGAKLAIRWPGSPPPFDPPSTIQDVFFSVAAFLLDDAAVLRYRLPRVTSGYGGLPDGAIREGVVTVGKDAGRRLFGSAP